MKLKVLIKEFLGLYPKVKITKQLPYQRFGNDYGGFEVYTETLNKNSIVYSFGIGEDISFDRDVINKFGCDVYGFDPTPRVQEWINKQTLPSEFKFYPIGLSNQDGSLIFYTPINPNHISHTAVKLDNKLQSEISVPCNKLSTIMKMNNHTHIDLLKIDIEGFEYGVIENIIAENIKINQFVVEFHHNFKGIGNKATENVISKLLQFGFGLYAISDNYQEFSFIKQ